MCLSWNLSISPKLSNSCIKLFLTLPYNPVNIYRTHIKLIALTLDTGNVLLHSLPGQSVWWILQTFSKNSLLALLSFYRLLCFLFYWLLLSVHSSAKLGFHLRLFITFPDMEAEVTALRPFLFFYDRHQVLQPSLRHAAVAYRNFQKPLLLFLVNSECFQISPLTSSVIHGSWGNELLVSQTIFLEQIPL